MPQAAVIRLKRDKQDISVLHAHFWEQGRFFHQPVDLCERMIQLSVYLQLYNDANLASILLEVIVTNPSIDVSSSG